MPTMLSPHFTLEEFVSPKVKRDKCALPFAECVDNLQALCVMVLEPWRTLEGPMGINSGLRDVLFNAALASDPASQARVAKRPGPHCRGEAGDVRILRINQLPEPERSHAYEEAFRRLYQLAQNGLPIHEAILEYQKGEAIAGAETSPRITHIHVQYRVGTAARRFVARRWKLDDNGALIEHYGIWLL